MKRSILEKFVHDEDICDLAGVWNGQFKGTGYKSYQEALVNALFTKWENRAYKYESDPNFKQNFKQEAIKLGFKYVPGHRYEWYNHSRGQINKHPLKFTFHLCDSQISAAMNLPYRKEFLELAKELVDNEEFPARLMKRVELEVRIRKNK